MINRSKDLKLKKFTLEFQEQNKRISNNSYVAIPQSPHTSHFCLLKLWVAQLSLLFSFSPLSPVISLSQICFN